MARGFSPLEKTEDPPKGVPSAKLWAAAGAAATLPPTTDYRVSIVNASGAGAYPISSFTWLLVYKTQPDAAKGKKLLDFVRWALVEGEKSAAALDYAPLPPAMAKQLLMKLSTVSLAAN